MAKRRKEKDEEEEQDFKMPKFDEEKFLKKERRNIKTTLLSFLFGILIAIISFGFWALLKGNDFRWELVLLFGVFSAAWIRYLFSKLNIDLTDFGRKGWLSSYAIYFFTWLLILIIIVNPPFYDDEAPDLEVVTLPEMQELGGTVQIVAKITDNTNIQKENIKFTITNPSGNDSSPDFTFNDSIFTYTFENTNNLTGEYSYTLEATDNSGQTTTEQKTFSYSNDTIKVPSPTGADAPPGPKVTYADTIKFDIQPTVDWLYYTINDGDEINASKQGEFYETFPKIEGWIRGQNVTMNVYAKVIYYFENSDIEYNNTIVDTTVYYFNVSDAAEIGVEDPPEISLPQPSFVQVPGFETIIFLISLIAVVLILKYRKNDRRK
jgi:hypothetical protein